MLTLVYKGTPHMVLSVSEAASTAMLDTITGLMDGGQIEILSADDDLIVTLQLSDPAAPAARDGEIELNPIRAGLAVSAGQAATARVVGPTGEVFVCDVTDLSGDGVIKLDKTQIRQGEPVRIHSFTLSMP